MVQDRRAVFLPLTVQPVICILISVAHVFTTMGYWGRVPCEATSNFISRVSSLVRGPCEARRSIMGEGVSGSAFRRINDAARMDTCGSRGLAGSGLVKESLGETCRRVAGLLRVWPRKLLDILWNVKDRHRNGGTTTQCCA